MKVVLVDREGTLIVDPPDDRVDSISKVRLLPHTIEGLSLFANNGFSIIIITNQTNIAQNRITLEEFWQINDYVLALLKPSGIKVLKTYVCPHNSADNCECRKPKPLMLESAIEKFSLDRSQTYMVGDRLSDIEAGLNARVQTILVKTGKQPVDTDRLYGSYIADNLLDAANYIVAH
jgi:histidinol-phosphate phosphatase family protein